MPTETQPVSFVLWHRRGRGRWQPVASAETYAAALDQIGVDGRRNGDWLVRPKGQDPNAQDPNARKE